MSGNDDIRYRLRNSAEDLGAAGWDTQYGCGMVNADLAINFSEPPDQSAPITTMTLNATKGVADWYLSDVEVILSAIDNDSGVAETKYSLDAGETWHTYTSPFTITTELTRHTVLARSWDNDGNDEGPPVFAKFRIDKVPPTVTETVYPTEFEREKKGYLVSVSYSGTFEDSGSGRYWPPNTVLIDEYGELDQDLGSSLSGQVHIEAYCSGGDKDGRTYIFRLTGRDIAGNWSSADAIVKVFK